MSVVQVFRDRLLNKSGHVYVSSGGTSISYGRLAEDISAIKKLLPEWQCGDQRIIAVSTENAYDMLLVVWLCLLEDISLVFCPRTQDPLQMFNLLQENGTSLLLTDIEAFKAESWAIYMPDRSGGIPADNVESQPFGNLLKSDALRGAFRFQTSGTEGVPKWVVCQFRQCLEAVECMWQEGALIHAIDQVVFLTAPLYHSYGLSSMLEYTRGGSSLVLPSGLSPFGPAGDLGNRDISSIVTAIEGVPFFHQQFTRLVSRFTLPTLKHIGFGGGSLDLDTFNLLRGHFTELTCSVRYGLTETPSVVSHKVFSSPYNSDWRSSGRIMPVYNVNIIGQDGSRLPIGTEGEIVVSGRCVSSYAGACSAGETVLRTGDYGFLNQDNELIVVGRKSVFLKHRGFRLSPEQIESVIRKCDGIEDCRVRMIDSKLVAEVVSTDVVSKSILLRRLAELLPVYSVPGEVVQIKEVPRTPSGKIKRY